jgi:hypothetical protein
LRGRELADRTRRAEDLFAVAVAMRLLERLSTRADDSVVDAHDA